VLERLDAGAVEELRPRLVQHPSPDIRRWLAERRSQASQDVFIAEPGGYELVRIPAGEFLMGSPESEEGRYNDEGPLHQVGYRTFTLAVTR